MRFVVALMLLFVAVPAEAGRGAALVKYLPDDATAVAAADIARVRGTAVWKVVYKLAREQNAAFDALATAQPVDKLVDTAVLGASADKQHAVIVLEGRIDKLLAEVKKTATKSDTHEGITFWSNNDGDVAIVDKKLVFSSPGEMASVIDRAKDKKAKGPATLRTLLAATNAGSGVVGGMLLDANQRADLGKQLGAEPQWATVSLAMSGKLGLDLRVHFASEAAAATAVKAITEQLTPETRGRVEGFVGKEFSDSIAVQQQLLFAKMTATLTVEEMSKVISLLKMLM